MLKKFLFILSEKNRAKLIFYFVLSLIFVGIETSILVIIYPLILFISHQKENLSKINLLEEIIKKVITQIEKSKKLER